MRGAGFALRGKFKAELQALCVAHAAATAEVDEVARSSAWCAHTVWSRLSAGRKPQEHFAWLVKLGVAQQNFRGMDAAEALTTAEDSPTAATQCEN